RAKRPSPLTLLAIVVALAVRRLRPRVVVLLAIVYGMVLGVGYGFRTDLLVDIPPFLVVTALFLPGGVRANAGLKLAAIALCLASFAATASPIIRTVTTSGGCQWH